MTEYAGYIVDTASTKTSAPFESLYSKNEAFRTVANEFISGDLGGKAYREAITFGSYILSETTANESKAGKMFRKTQQLIRERRLNGSESSAESVPAQKQNNTAETKAALPAAIEQMITGDNVSATEKMRTQNLDNFSQKQNYGYNTHTAFINSYDGAVGSETYANEWNAVYQQARQGRTENEILRQPHLSDAQARSAISAGIAAAEREQAIRNAAAKNKNLSDIAKKFGTEVVFEDTLDTDGVKSNGYKDENGIIHIDYEAKNPAAVVFRHEMTHYAERAKEKYSAFAETVRRSKTYGEWLAENTRLAEDGERTSLTLGEAQLRDKIIKEYREHGVRLSPEAAQAEIIADFVQDTLFADNGTTLDSLIRGLDKKQRDGIIGFLQDFIEWIKNKLDHKDIPKEILTLERKLTAALAEAKDGENGGVSYSIGYTTDNKPVVIVNDDILRNVYKNKDIISVVKNSLGRFKKVPIKKQSIYFITDTKKEYTNSKYTQNLRKNNQAVYKDKMRLSAHPQDIIYATTDYVNEAPKHPRKDNIIDFARGNLLIDIMGKKYSAEVVIGFMKSGICELHDVVNISPTDFEIKKEALSESMDLKKSARSDRTSSNNRISQREPVVNSILREISKKDTKKLSDISNSGKQHLFPLDNSDNGDYNNTTNREVNSYEPTDEFRRLQEESRTLSERDLSLYRSGDQTPNESIRRRLSGILSRQLDTVYGERSNDNGILNLNAKGNRFDIYEDVNPQLFHDVFEIARCYLENGELVDLHEVNTTEDGIGYKDCLNFLSKDGLSGFSITPDGDLISVFNASGKKGFLRAISDIIKEKSKTLDCYASAKQNLMNIYSKVFGFKTASVMEYNMEYDHDNIAENHGSPQVAFMVNTPENVETRYFTENQYDEAVAYRNSFLSGKQYLFPEDGEVDERIAIKAADLTRRYRNGEITTDEYARQQSELWDKANEQYGSIEKGEKPKADVDVPKTVDGRYKTRRFARTALEADIGDRIATEQVRSDILTGKLAYKTLSDQVAIKHAEDAIQNGTAESKWAQAYAEGRFDKNTVAIGEALLRMYAERHDNAKLVNILSEIAEVGTTAGQTVQAMSLLKDMDGVSQLVYVRKVVDRLNNNLEKRYKNKKNVPHIELSDVLMQQLVDSKTQGDFDVTYDAIMQDVADQLPVTFADKFNAWRYFAMLGNPRTHIRNIVGNAIFTPAVRTKDVIAAAIEKTLPAEQRTKSFKVKSEYRNYATSDFDNVVGLLTGDGKYNISNDIRNRQRLFKSSFLQWLNKAIGLNTNALEAEDLLFLKRHYIHALGGFLQARNVDLSNVDNKTLFEAREYAKTEAQKATFRDISAAASALNRLSNTSLAAKVAVEGLLPFKKTPINVMKRGIEYSPIGLLNALTKGVYDLRHEKITAAQWIDSFSAGLTGTGIAALGALAQSLGLVSVGFGKDDEDYFKQLNGDQEYAIRIGDMTFTIDWAAPSAIPFFVGAEAWKAFKDDDKEMFPAFVDAMLAVAAPITNLSMLSGVESALKGVAYGSESSIATVMLDTFQSFVGQVVPTLFGQIARTIDTTRRRNYIDKNSTVPEFLQEMWNTTAGKIGHKYR